MTFDLTTLQAEVSSRPPRLIIYGGAGSGKTTLAASMPSPVFLDLEGGIDGIEAAKVTAKDWMQVTDFLRATLEQEHSFQTLVIDSLDWLEELIHKRVCQEESVSNIEDIPYAKGYSKAMKYWEKFFTYLTLIRDRKNMTITCICHDAIVKIDSPLQEPYDRHALKLHKKAAALSSEWADCIAFLTTRMIFVKEDSGFGKEHKQPKAKERLFITEDIGAALAKRRAHVNLPDKAVLPQEDGWNQLTQKGGK